MNCPIQGLTFSPKSKKAIDEMRDLTKRANLLGILTGSAVLNDIFFKNGPVSAMYKINSTDFETLGRALKGTNLILKERIRFVSGMIQLERGLTSKEKLFWRCVYNEAH